MRFYGTWPVQTRRPLQSSSAATRCRSLNWPSARMATGWPRPATNLILIRVNMIPRLGYGISHAPIRLRDL